MIELKSFNRRCVESLIHNFWTNKWFSKGGKWFFANIYTPKMHIACVICIPPMGIWYAIKFEEPDKMFTGKPLKSS